MQKYNLSFRNKSFPQRLALLEKLVAHSDALTADQQLAIPALAEFRQQTAAARASHDRLAALRAEVQAELTLRKAAFAVAQGNAGRVGNGLAASVDWQPAGMQGLGLELPASNTKRLGPAAAPANLRAAPTGREGEAQLRWKRPQRRCAFEVQWHRDPPGADQWTPAPVCLRQSCLIKGLVSGRKYWFRVRAHTTTGPGPWSQPVGVRVK